MVKVPPDQRPLQPGLACWGPVVVRAQSELGLTLESPQASLAQMGRLPEGGGEEELHCVFRTGCLGGGGAVSQSPAGPQASHGTRSSDSQAREPMLCSVKLGAKGVPVTPHWGDPGCVPALTPQGGPLRTTAGDHPRQSAPIPSQTCTVVFLSPRRPIKKFTFVSGEVTVGILGPRTAESEFKRGARAWGLGEESVGGGRAGRRGEGTNLPV